MAFGVLYSFSNMNIKATSDISEKWARVTPQRSVDYKKGVENPTKDWKAATAEAEESYKTGVSEAANAGRFGKGVNKAGTEKWKAKAVTKGVDRWGPGVQIAKPDYEAGFAPYASTIAALTLPPRYPKGDPRNLDRVSAIAVALRAKKVGA